MRLRRVSFFARSVVATVSLLATGISQAQSHIHNPDETKTDSEAASLNISGQLRERATYLSALDYNADAEAAGWFWTQRARITADAQATAWFRARASVVSALTQGGDNESPIERNDLDLQEGFVELGPTSTFLRIGRQELRLGSQRLVATRDGTNVRRTWDGARLYMVQGEWEFDAFALRLVDVDFDGVFNDGRNNGRELAGLYATRPALIGEIDLFYLYAELDGRRTIEGTRNEKRHSLGARLFGDQSGWFWDWEAIYQFGSFGDGQISAWTFASNTGRRWTEILWSPEFMLSANIASGDSDPGDGRLKTFNALYPRGSYFSENALLGPANFFNVHPNLLVRPRDNVLLFVNVNFFWRLQTRDGVYGPPGVFIREPLGSDERFVDVSVSAGVEWEASEHVFASILFTHSEPQNFIRETGVAEAVDFVEFTVNFSF